MLFKIAVKNIKRSIKDYAVYFLTLTLGICLFYVFNSIDAQKSVIMEEQYEGILDNLTTLMGMLSILVSFVLAGLIIFANNFLIKRRKREFGIYVSLGMSRRKISTILIIENIIVGLAALVAGILAGILISQGMAVFTAKLLSVRLKGYTLLFSSSAFVKTILSFGVLFIIVMIFNVVSVSKYNLYNLIYASKKNEKIGIQNPFLLILLFALSVVLLAAAYLTTYDMGVKIFDNIYLPLATGVSGTFLFFFSISGFVVLMLKKSKKFYFKNLNIFLLRQINNKVVTNFLSMSVISMLLFIALTVSTTMFLYRELMESQLSGITKCDALIYIHSYDKKNAHEVSQKYLDNFADQFNKDNASGIELGSNIETAAIKLNYIERETKANDGIIGEDVKTFLSNHVTDKEDIENANYYGLYAVKVSHFNKLRKIQGMNEINISDNEVYIVAGKNITEKTEKDFYDTSKGIVKFLGDEYKLANDKFDRMAFFTTGTEDPNYIIVIVPDNFEHLSNMYHDTVSGYYYDIMPEGVNNDDYVLREPGYVMVSMMFTGSESDKIETDNKLRKIRDWENNLSNDEINVWFEIQVTQDQIRMIYSFGAVIVYIGIYIGLVFLLTSVAVLSMQQLSDASDSAERFKALSRMGISEKMMSKVILRQILIYFSLPFILAVISSIAAMAAINKIFTFFIRNMTSIFDYVFGAAPMAAFLAIIGIFVIYIILTYKTYKSIVLRK